MTGIKEIGRGRDLSLMEALWCEEIVIHGIAIKSARSVETAYGCSMVPFKG